MPLPESIHPDHILERLPNGPKSASRLAFFLLRAPEDVAQDLATALANLKANTALCPECFNIMEAGRVRCEICESPNRESALICVVEEPLDVLALERTGGFQGKYHVLQGVLSPIEGIGPDDLKIKQLLERVRQGGTSEVIWRNPSMEGDATALYLRQNLSRWGQGDAAGAGCGGGPGIRRPEYVVESVIGKTRDELATAPYGAPFFIRSAARIASSSGI
jgi:recombination protein RecR